MYTKILFLICFGMLSVFLKSQVLCEGLVAWYPFNSNVNDESGNGNHGINQGAASTTDRFGNENSAYYFNGSNAQVVVQNSEILDNLDYISISAWIKPVSFEGEGNNSIVDKRYYSHNNPYYQYHLGITGDLWTNIPGSFLFCVSVNYDFKYVISPAHTWIPGNWYYVVGTYDGDSLKLYVNGSEKASLYAPGTIDHFGNEIHIGKLGNYTEAYTPGTIDEVKIYNCALSEEEILKLYQPEYIVNKIEGDIAVCQGQTGVNYIVAPVSGTGYSWSYSGSGANISGNAESVIIDFDNNATSGMLSVNFNDGTGNRIVQQEITVDRLPSGTGVITGESTVCKNQSGMSFSVAAIDNATSYIWSYSGTGAIIAGNSNIINMNFSANATSGNLVVTGYNHCGSGISSQVFPVNLIACDEIPVDFNIPNAFSPNGDGINDVFFIRGLLEHSTLTIFDRSGEKLYETDDYKNDWDGRDNQGKALESGTYWYVFTMHQINAVYKGYVYIKR